MIFALESILNIFAIEFNYSVIVLIKPILVEYRFGICNIEGHSGVCPANGKDYFLA
jgi:hypothetical protein